MTGRVIVIGGGGHAGVVIELLKLRGHDILGIADPGLDMSGGRAHGVAVLGGDDAVSAHPKDAVRLVNGLGSTSRIDLRATVFRKFKEQGWRFLTLIHPTATVASDVEIGEGGQIMAGAIVQNGVALADNVLVNTGASVDHDCRIGANVHIGPGAVLSGGVTVEDDVHIGVGAVVVQSVTLGRGSHIGAGAVVTESLPAGCRARIAGMQIGVGRE